MYRKTLVLIQIVAILAAGWMFIGCESNLNSNMSVGEGTLKLVFLIPDYDLMQTELMASRVIDPQSEIVEIYLDGNLFSSVSVSQFTDTNTETLSGFATEKTGTFLVPAGTYNEVKLKIYDVDNNLLTEGANSVPFTLAEDGTSEVTIINLPVNLEDMESYGVENIGVLDPGHMKFYGIIAQEGLTYTVSLTGNDMGMHLIDPTGIIESSNSSEIVFSTGTGNDGLLYYIGIYSTAGGSYSLTVAKSGTPLSASNILISEVSLYNYFYGNGFGIELYNPTDAPIDVNGWKFIISRRWDDDFWSSFDTQELAIFPTAEIPVSGYLAVLERWDPYDESVKNSVSQQMLISQEDYWSIYYDNNLGLNYRYFSLRNYWDQYELPGGSFENGEYIYSTRQYDDGLTYQDSRVFVLSPDGTKVVYTDEFSSFVDPDWVLVKDIRYFDLNTFDPGNPQTIAVGDSYFMDIQPAWSADGTEIVFSSNRFDGRFEICKVSLADPSVVIRLTQSTGNKYSPSFSPDGTIVVYSAEDMVNGDYDLYTVNSDGLFGGTALTDNFDIDMTPAWSPDGSRIVFIRDTGGGDKDIYTIAADGTNELNRTNYPSTYKFPNWIDSESFSYSEYFSGIDDWGNYREYYQINTLDLSNDEQIKIASWDNGEVFFLRAGNSGFAADKLNYVYGYGIADNSTYEYASYYYHYWYFDNNYTYSIALVDDTGLGVDFVLVNGRNISPPVGTSWDKLSGIVTHEDSTIARKIEGGVLIDTNSAQDWETSYGTMGFPNNTESPQGMDLHIY